MLYYIDQSVVVAAQNDEKQALDCLMDLGQSWKNGQCLVSASRLTFGVLNKIRNLEIYSLIEKYAQGVHSLHATLDFFVVLVSNNAKVSALQQFANKYVVMDVSEYTDIKQIHNNYLVCENVRDCEFYIFCANHMFADTMGNTYQLNILKGNGGGGTIVDVLKSYSLYSCLVICDTDKKYPNCKDGQTLEGVSNYFKAQYGHRLWMYALHVHEIENLVPVKLLEAVVRGNKQHRGRLGVLQSIRDENLKNEFLKHFDFKKGLGVGLLIEIKENDAQFFEKCSQVLLQIGKSQHDIDKAIAKYERKKELKKAGAKVKDSAPQLVNGLGDTIFGETLEFIQNNDVNPSVLEREDYQKQDWNAVANKVWSLGCAMFPRRL